MSSCVEETPLKLYDELNDDLNETPPPKKNKRVGNYKLLKTIGKGTFGKVKLAENVETGSQVAVKIIEKANVSTLKQKHSVQREVRLMKLLNHPNIVKVFDILETETEIYIAMELADGGELFDYIVAQGKVKEIEARKFFREIISAVDYCHRNSVIHRDLKPENLLLDKDRNLKIIDFGFGNTFHRERTLDTYCGSPYYAAPEMILGIRYIGPEVDIWSLGVILYALIAGYLPFDSETMNQLYEKIIIGAYVTPEHFSKDVSDLIQKVLTVEASKRATMLDILNHSWTNIGYTSIPVSHVPLRPEVVLTPNEESFQELLSYGIEELEVRKVLGRNSGAHPISSLYHLIDEARCRTHKVEMHPQKQQHEQEDHLNLSNENMAKSSSTTSIKSENERISAIRRGTTVRPKIGDPRRIVSNGYEIKNYYNDVIQHVEKGFSEPTNIGVELRSNSNTQRVASARVRGKNGGNGKDINNKRSISGSNIINQFTHMFKDGFSLKAKSSVKDSAYGSTKLGESSLGDLVTLKSLPLIKGVFNVCTTSSKPVKEISDEILRVLGYNQIRFQQTDPYTFLCEDITQISKRQKSVNSLEIVICRIPRMEGMHGLHLKRTRGNVWTHKKLCSQLVEQMRL